MPEENKEDEKITIKELTDIQLISEKITVNSGEKTKIIIVQKPYILSD